MCIWKVEPEDRRCEYCSYRGGCENRPGDDLERAERLLRRYRSLMIGLIGRDILCKSRDHEIVWARNIVIYALYNEGIKPRVIGSLLGLDRSTTIYARNQVRNMMKYQSMYNEEYGLFLKFFNKLRQDV